MLADREVISAHFQVYGIAQRGIPHHFDTRTGQQAHLQ